MLSCIRREARLCLHHKACLSVYRTGESLEMMSDADKRLHSVPQAPNRRSCLACVIVNRGSSSSAHVLDDFSFENIGAPDASEPGGKRHSCIAGSPRVGDPRVGGGTSPRNHGLPTRRGAKPRARQGVQTSLRGASALHRAVRRAFLPRVNRRDVEGEGAAPSPSLASRIEILYSVSTIMYRSKTHFSGSGSFGV
jgi:hypothetical protein